MAANTHGVQFSGTDRIQFGTNAKACSIRNLDAFTLEAWMKVSADATNPNARAYLERQGSGKLPRLSMTGYNDTSKNRGVLRFEFSRLDNKSDTNYTYTLQELWDDYWHHVAFTVDIEEKEYEIYYDGARVAVGTVPDGGVDGEDASLLVADTAPQHIWLGAHFDGTNIVYWHGKLDNVRLWSAVRSQSSLQNERLDHLEDPSSETNLIEEWRLNEGTGSSTAGAKNPTWTSTLLRDGGLSSALWTTDRPFMGDSNDDETVPSTPTMQAPSDITEDGFTLSWTGSTDNVYVQYYEVTVATDNTFDSPIEGYAARNVGLNLSETLSGLTPATNYFARVRAVDAALNASDYSTYNTNAAITTDSVGDVTAPSAPVATAATNITATSFTANWTAPDEDETGFTLDIAYDADFTNFVLGWRNVNVGDVETYNIETTILPATRYYYRVRAYDAAGNESGHSNSITLVTSPPPDTTPPDIVITLPATSVASRSFTANWLPGVDNVAVTSYRLDVSATDDFAVLLLGDLNVGNVLSYGVTGLEPETTYYYRVRAVDAALNVSANTTDPELVITDPALVDESGLLRTAFEPSEDTYIDETSASTNYGSSTTLVVDGTDEKIALLKFDLSDVEGTIVNANLNLYVTDATDAQLTVQTVTDGSWDEETLTWTNETLTYSDAFVTFTAAETGWVEVDVASLLDGPDEYTLVLTISSTNEVIFESREGDNIPYLVVETDPSSATEVESLSFTTDILNVTNLLKNPGAETGGPSFGGATGIVALGSATLAQETSTSLVFEGTNSCRVTTTAVADDGVTYETPTGLDIEGTGQTIQAAFMLYATGSTHALRAILEITYDDSSTSTGDEVTISHHTTTRWTFVTLSAVATNGKTIDKIGLHVYQSDATVRTFYVDGAIVADYDDLLPIFTGSHNIYTDWDGDTNASTSTISLPTLVADASYVGDGDEDNSAAVALKQVSSLDWLSNDRLTVEINRTTKHAVATVLPFLTINEISNPTFAASTLNWGSWGSGSPTRQQITDDGLEEPGDAHRACMEVVCPGGNPSQGAVFAVNNPSVGVEYTFSAYVAHISGDTSLRIFAAFYNSTPTFISETTELFTATSEFERQEVTFTVPANTSHMYVGIGHINTNDATTFRVDHVQLERNSYATPYGDGSMDGWFWMGKPYESPSYQVLVPDTDYDIEFTFTDPDGVSGTNPFSIQAHTPYPPDDPVTLVSLTLTPSLTGIAVEALYSGDDNESGEFTVSWRRSDLSTWSPVVFSLDRNDRAVRANISGLRPGVRYDVRVDATDDDDVVFGGTFVDNNHGYLQGSTTTLIDTTVDGHPQSKVTFGGFVLQSDEVSWVGVIEHDAFKLPDRRVAVSDLPRHDGAVELSDWWGRKEINIKGYVKGTSRENLQERLGEIRRALAPRRQRLVIDTLDNRSFFYTATCVSFESPEIGGETITHVEWEAQFLCADPFRYASEETVEEGIDMVNLDEVAISNDGDLSVEPVFTLTTTSTQDVWFTLINSTTGERIHAIPGLRQGDRIVIDSARKSVTKNGVEVDYQGSFPRLAVGQNTILIYLNNFSVTLRVQRRHRYF